MRILVTGAAGFIGSHLCERLLQLGENHVIGLDNFDPFYSRTQKDDNLVFLKENPNFSLIEGSLDEINDLEELQSEKPDLVIHLAAKAGVLPSIKDPNGYIHTNINGTLSLLDWMKDKGIGNLIFGSSSSIYGNYPVTPFREDMKVSQPISPYALTKASGEMMTYNYYHLYDINCINLRFFTVIGPRQRPDLAIHKFFNLIQKGEPIKLYGDGSSARDYTYVDDIVSGVMASIDLLTSSAGIYEVINLGNHKPVTLGEMVEVIESISDVPVKKDHVPFQPGDVDVTYADIAKARTLLGYEPSTSFEDGVKAFYEWFKESRLVS